MVLRQTEVVSEPAEHWEAVYARAPVTALSWFQSDPAISLRLIERAAPATTSAILDVGCGASLLADHLVERGYRDLTLLDCAASALSTVRDRLGSLASTVRFVVGDVCDFEPERRYDCWHDRAVFHFLTDPVRQERYVGLAARAVARGGSLVLGSFAEDGPEQCSGLAVVRRSAEALEEQFAGSFALVEHEREDHVTPSGAVQHFTWVVLRRS
jgi:SAM-dependent methyltransferase